ncbi:MAG: hypothetical protein V4605_08825 [Pseudomonadota bacterium]
MTGLEKKIYGRIDCPCCGFADGMRITADKNGAPFGFCDANCDTQLRIGGSQKRVREFFQRYPLIEKAFNPVTVTEKNEDILHSVSEAQQTVTVTEKKAGFSLGAL